MIGEVSGVLTPLRIGATKIELNILFEDDTDVYLTRLTAVTLDGTAVTSTGAARRKEIHNWLVDHPGATATVTTDPRNTGRASAVDFTSI